MGRLVNTVKHHNSLCNNDITPRTNNLISPKLGQNHFGLQNNHSDFGREYANLLKILAINSIYSGLADNKNIILNVNVGIIIPTMVYAGGRSDISHDSYNNKTLYSTTNAHLSQN